MHSNRVSTLIQWWVTPKLPKEHIFISKEKMPKDWREILRVYTRKWLIHPIKRRIAKYYLVFLQKFCGLTVIGITGSAGKTTTKEMLASILSQKGETIATYKNIDSIYNIPTTILRCKPQTKFLVLEMGVEFSGEMDFYLWLARPTIGVITNIYPTHTQFLGNVEGVAKEKVKLIQALPKDGYAILNSESYFVKKYSKKTRAKITWYGKNTMIRAENQSITSKLDTKYTLNLMSSKINIHLPLLGEQFVSNSLAAVAVGYVCGASLDQIKAGLESLSKEEHRMVVIRHPSGAIILDDSYNNNPEAAKEALGTLKSISRNRKMIVVFGDMLELGELEERYHREMGKLIAFLGVDYLIGVGNASKTLVNEAEKSIPENHLRWVKKSENVYPILTPLLNRNGVVLVKGSRSIGLDKLVSKLSR